MVRAKPRLLLTSWTRLALSAVFPEQMHLEALVILVRHLTNGAGIRAVLLVIEHVLSQSRLTLEARVTNVAKRMGTQMRLQHV